MVIFKSVHKKTFFEMQYEQKACVYFVACRCRIKSSGFELQKKLKKIAEWFSWTFFCLHVCSLRIVAVSLSELLLLQVVVSPLLPKVDHWAELCCKPGNLSGIKPWQLPVSDCRGREVVQVKKAFIFWIFLSMSKTRVRKSRVSSLRRHPKI